MITRADKGNSIVILPTHQYETKIQNFILNNFRTATTDPSNTLQAQIRQTVRDSKTLIPKVSRWKYTNRNPSAPSIKRLIKIHKPDQPIRPVVNWRNAAAYRLSKLFTEKIHHIALLPSAFNIKNTQDLLHKLKDTPLFPNHSLASLDITNLYSNIPVPENKTILTNLLKHELVTPQTQKELLKWYDVITGQNYFTHNRDIIFQYDGLAMGAPSSGLIAEIIIRHIEHTYLPHVARKHKIVNYCRYVDDVFLVFDSTHTSIHEILKDFNGLHHKLQFTAEAEKTTPLTTLTSPCTEPPLTLKPPYTESPHSQTPSSPTPPTTPNNTNAQQSGSYSTDRTSTTSNMSNSSKN